MGKQITTNLENCMKSLLLIGKRGPIIGPTNRALVSPCIGYWCTTYQDNMSLFCNLQVQIFLTSPQGTRSTLLTRRPRDTSTEGFNEWAFMTTHNWGEYSLGTWTLEIVNDGATCKYWGVFVGNILIMNYK